MYSPIITPLRRKGSLNLSINAIVVLILAITMLGLGLGFIRNIFGGASAQIGQALESTSLKNPADSSNPLTIDDKITMKRKAEKQIEVGFYNTRTENVKNARLEITECRTTRGDKFGENAADAYGLPIVAAPWADEIPASEGTGFKAILSFPDEASTPPQGTYICRLGVKGDIVGGDSDKLLRNTQFFLSLTS